MTAGTTILGAPRPIWTRAAVVPQAARWLPLAFILLVQAVLSVRLISHSYVSGDEGRYIYAGHQLIYEFWHGGGSPYYETYFSGAPAIYPVLAAMADHLGGLVEACLLSLAFMLTATTLLFTTTRRLFGYWPGVLAAGLFAGLGLTQDLGVLATYDAMALMLTAAAAYCAVRTADAEKRATAWLLAIPLVLLAANATKYMTVLFDPVVIALAALQVSDCGWRRMAARITALGVATASILTLALFLAGGAYVNGLMFSTLARPSGSQAVFSAVVAPRSVIVGDTWRWMGVTLVGSLIALVLAARSGKGWKPVALVGLLLLAGIAVTVEGLHLQTVESLRKHDDFAAWFACVAAGSGAGLPRLQSRFAGWITALAVGSAAILSGIQYTSLAGSTFEAGGSSRPLYVAAALKSYLAIPHGRYLIGGLGEDQILYLDHLPVRWFQRFDDLYIKYPIPGRGGDSHGQAPGLACFRLEPHCMYLEGIAGYSAAIRAHWFTLISMYGAHGTKQDAQIVTAIDRTPGYVLLTQVGGAPTWIYPPAYHEPG